MTGWQRLWTVVAVVLCVAMCAWTLVVVVLTHDAVVDMQRANAPVHVRAEPTP